mmetsp:Transcript_21832/g.38597  ORF Transcript_21832/g.38597 Transcript_21832/m.38597 type:complete len:204 (-) Transcript_21832:38-649(-)
MPSLSPHEHSFCSSSPSRSSVSLTARMPSASLLRVAAINESNSSACWTMSRTLPSRCSFILSAWAWSRAIDMGSSFTSSMLCVSFRTTSSTCTLSATSELIRDSWSEFTAKRSLLAPFATLHSPRTASTSSHSGDSCWLSFSIARSSTWYSFTTSAALQDASTPSRLCISVFAMTCCTRLSSGSVCLVLSTEMLCPGSEDATT